MTGVHNILLVGKESDKEIEIDWEGEAERESKNGWKKTTEEKKTMRMNIYRLVHNI